MECDLHKTSNCPFSDSAGGTCIGDSSSLALTRGPPCARLAAYQRRRGCAAMLTEGRGGSIYHDENNDNNAMPVLPVESSAA